MKNILEVKPQGFCGGVRKAIETALAVREANPEATITILGSLVHNRWIREALEQAHIHTLEEPGKTRYELLDQVPEGIVIFTAHGVSPRVRQKAADLGLQVIDASCPFVLSTQKIVDEKRAEGYAIFYIGKNHHPEAEGVYDGRDDVYLIESEKDIPEGIRQPILATNQTTMSAADLQDVFAAIKEAYPQAEILDELCSATRVRQQAVANLEGQDIDLLLVVGDPHSNNTRQLENTGKKAGIPHTLRIESAEDLPDWVFDMGRIAVTSGASTPAALRDRVLEVLNDPQTERAVPLEELLQTKRKS